MIYLPMDWEYSYKMSWKTFLSICFHCKSIKQNSQHTRGTNKYKNLFLKCQISIFKGAAPAVRVQYRPFTIRLPLAPKASVRGNTTSKKHLQNNKNTQEIGCTVRAQPRFSLLLSWNDETQRCSWRRIRHGHTLWFCVPPLLQCGSFAALVLFSS